MFESEYLMWVAALGVLVGSLVSIELGRRLGQWHSGREQEAARAGLGAIDGAIFALLGLLLAFTFSGAASRFDTRRQLIVEETNAIGTAYLRLDLLPPAARANLQDQFRKYVDARLDVYRDVTDTVATQSRLAHVGELQLEIWRQTLEACPSATASSERMLLIPALNQMFDIATARTLAGRMHPPRVIFTMLAVLIIMSSLLAGFGMAQSARRSWLHIGSLALMLAITFYVIVDLEHPRIGLIQVDPFDRALTELRQSMN